MSHSHLEELPGRIARKGSNIAKYRDEILWAQTALVYTNDKLQLSANNASFHIKHITSDASMMPIPSLVYESVRDFVYHYENYCLRLYIYREKVIHFLNVALKIDYPDGSVNFKLVSQNQIVTKAGLASVIERFTSNTNALGKLIKHRKTLTHRQSYGLADPYLRPDSEGVKPEEFKDWSRKWQRNIAERAKLADAANKQLYTINHTLSEKVIAYRSTKTSQA
jgi:hypothetical protein